MPGRLNVIVQWQGIEFIVPLNAQRFIVPTLQRGNAAQGRSSVPLNTASTNYYGKKPIHHNRA